MADEPEVTGRPRVGISRCLLGEKVRYDGGDKRDASLLDTLGSEVEWVAVCPEVEVGMGVPREPVHLVAGPDTASVRLLGVETVRDWTDRMENWARERLEQLASSNLSGFVLKARSPSCGLRDVPIHSRESSTSAAGRGMFARALTDAFPDLPVEDEETLRDEAARAAFVSLVFAYHRRRARFAVTTLRQGCNAIDAGAIVPGVNDGFAEKPRTSFKVPR